MTIVEFHDVEVYTNDGLEIQAKRLNGRLQEIAAEKARREAEAAAKKTVGQRVAEEAVGVGCCQVSVSGPSTGYVFLTRPDQSPVVIRDGLRRAIAGIVDKVRADTIEECAKKVGSMPAITFNADDDALIHYSQTASAIRALK